MIARCGWLLVAGLVLVASVAHAQATVTDTALERRTSELASELRCPVCQGESIQDSPSALAQEMRALVREQLAAGRSPEEVKAYFVSKYGEWILLQPRARGINLVVYLAPFVIIVVGTAVIVLAVRRWTRQTQLPVEHPAESLPER